MLLHLILVCKHPYWRRKNLELPFNRGKPSSETWHPSVFFPTPFQGSFLIAKKPSYDHQAQPLDIQGYLNTKLKIFFLVLTNSCQAAPIACTKRKLCLRGFHFILWVVKPELTATRWWLMRASCAKGSPAGVVTLSEVLCRRRKFNGLPQMKRDSSCFRRTWWQLVLFGVCRTLWIQLGCFSKSKTFHNLLLT